MANDILTDTLRQLLRDPVSAQSVALSEDSLESLAHKLAIGSTPAGGMPGAAPGVGEPSQRNTVDLALAEAQDRLARQLAWLTEAAQQQTQTTEANTAAVIESSVTRLTGDSESKIASLGKTMGSFLGGGFSLFKLVGSLFGGDKSEAMATPVKFTLPTAVNYEGALTGVGTYVSPVRYGQDALPRAVAPARSTAD